MKVAKLIECLQQMPQDADVRHLWDGEARTGIEFVWVSRSLEVITADYKEVSYSCEDWPWSVRPGLKTWETPRQSEHRGGVLV